MVDVTLINLNEVQDEIRTSLENAAYICIDIEYTGSVGAEENQKTKFTYFDDASSMYEKLRHNIVRINAVQFGLSIFRYNSEQNEYHVSVYRFYVFPSKVTGETFSFESSNIQFLSEHDFDFNALIYNGLPYLRREEEDFLTKLLERNEFTKYLAEKLPENVIHILEKELNRVKKWNKTASFNDTLLLKPKWPMNIVYMMNFYLQSVLRSDFQSVWTKTHDFERVQITKITLCEYHMLKETSGHDLDENFLFKLRGFNNIFQLLVDCKKPLVGHNMLFDLAIMYKQFYEPLPHNYRSFKNNIYKLFPIIYDTKHISYGLSNRIGKNVRWKSNNLAELYTCLRNGLLSKILMHSSSVIASNIKVRDILFHDAAYDSYVTGFVFVKLAHLHTSVSISGKQQNCSKMSNMQCFKVLESYKNRVNIGRSKTPYMNFEGSDPSNDRPPLLYVSRKDGNNIDIAQFTKILKNRCISFDAVQLSRKSLLLAVSNFNRYNMILNVSEDDQIFRIIHYQPIIHSSRSRNIFWYGIFVTAIIAIAFYMWLRYAEKLLCNLACKQ